MKRISALLLALCMLLAAGCTRTASPDSAPEGITLDVVTTYGSDDANRSNYESLIKTWEITTGNTVRDASQTAMETFKAQVRADFETGSEADILFFFNGADADSFVASGGVVPISEIQQAFPEYGYNIDMSVVPSSQLDGVQYALATYGYWEALFVNKRVCEAAGVSIPDENTTWDEFLDICQAIKDAGYIPIACSLQEVPHYWFEYCVMNNGGVDAHLQIPTGPDSPTWDSWVAGLNDIRELYQRGFLPVNTLRAGDATTFALLRERAAFAIDGSWKCGWFTPAGEGHIEGADDFTVTYVPGKGPRSATDIVTGLSSGWYITRKCWNDESKRAAAVSFISTMTSDVAVNTFRDPSSPTSLANEAATVAPISLNSLQVAALEMMLGATGKSPAVQDDLGIARDALFANIKYIADGSITAEDALSEALALLGSGD